MQEFEFSASIPVWFKLPKMKNFERTGRPPISARWIDVNEADERDPNYRSRYVARQLNALDRSGACYFAPAPPLEAMRTVLSMSMTRCGHKWQPIYEPKSKRRMQLSFIDIKRAYFNAKVDREAAPRFLELPPQDPEPGPCAESCSDTCMELCPPRTDCSKSAARP